MAFSPRTLRLFSCEIFVLLEIGPVTCPGCDESQCGESVASTSRSPPRYSTAHSKRPSSNGSQPTSRPWLKTAEGRRFSPGTRDGKFSLCASTPDVQQGI